MAGLKHELGSYVAVWNLYHPATVTNIMHGGSLHTTQRTHILSKLPYLPAHSASPFLAVSNLLRLYIFHRMMVKLVIVYVAAAEMTIV